MKLEARIDTKRVDAMLRDQMRKMPRRTKKALDRTGWQGVDRLRTRTSKGKGVYGAFPPYSTSYAAWRQKKGRQIAHRDLFVSGQMLNSLLVKTTSRYTDITSTRAQERKKIIWTHTQTPWFGFNKRERRWIVDEFVRQFRKAK